MKFKGETIECLNRKVRFGKLGLPESIVSNGREILAEPIKFVVERNMGQGTRGKSKGKLVSLSSQNASKKWLKRNDAVAEWQVKSSSDDFDLLVGTKMEFDGCITHSVTVKAKRNVSVRDIRLEVPIRKEVATYMMGMGWRGGKRPKEWHWRWDAKRPNNMVWVGDWD
ncbi:MAG: DUF6067 family protein, partial [Armatimonadetes bacterium]|nr:DUF6067 family protein [Armatimonadota bacterium]